MDVVISLCNGTSRAISYRGLRSLTFFLSINIQGYSELLSGF